MFQVDNRSFRYNNIDFHYDIAGEGAPLVIMHGWGCNRTTVKSISETALKCGYKVYSVDFPGFGKSTEPDSVWGVEDYSRLMEAFFSSEGIKNPVLIGHSFGGRVGIVLSSRNDVSKLILVDSAGIRPHRSVNYYFKVYSFKLAKKFWRIILGKNKSEQKIEEIRKRRGSGDYSLATPMMRMILSRVVNEDLKKLMPKIKAPTLLIWGTNDTATPLKDAKTMEKLIADAGLVEIEGAGHYSFLDNPIFFRAVLTNFLLH